MPNVKVPANNITVESKAIALRLIPIRLDNAILEAFICTTPFSLDDLVEDKRPENSSATVF